MSIHAPIHFIQSVINNASSERSFRACDKLWVCLETMVLRPEGPTVRRPGRKAGIPFRMKIERRGRGTIEFSGAAPSALRLSAIFIPALRPGLFIAGPSGLNGHKITLAGTKSRFPVLMRASRNSDNIRLPGMRQNLCRSSGPNDHKITLAGTKSRLPVLMRASRNSDNIRLPGMRQNLCRSSGLNDHKITLACTKSRFPVLMRASRNSDNIQLPGIRQNLCRSV